LARAKCTEGNRDEARLRRSNGVPSWGYSTEPKTTLIIGYGVQPQRQAFPPNGDDGAPHGPRIRTGRVDDSRECAAARRHGRVHISLGNGKRYRRKCDDQ
jgi:hypothetical protein